MVQIIRAFFVMGPDLNITGFQCAIIVSRFFYRMCLLCAIPNMCMTIGFVCLIFHSTTGGMGSQSLFDRLGFMWA